MRNILCAVLLFIRIKSILSRSHLIDEQVVEESSNSKRLLDSEAESTTQAISISKASDLSAVDEVGELAIYRAYTTFYQQQSGLLPDDVVLTYGAPCLGLPRIDSPLLAGPYVQNTAIYTNSSLVCEDFGGMTWGGVQRSFPRGLQAFDLIMQYGAMVRKELTQRSTHAGAVLAATVEAFKAIPGGRDLTMGAPTNAEEWTQFWATLSQVSLTPQPGLPFGIAPAPESIISPYNEKGVVADFIASDINDPMTDEFLENNVGNAYAFEWVSYDAQDLIVAYPEVANLPRFELDGTYLALDLARWMPFTGKYKDTNFTPGIQFPFGGEIVDVTIRDLPVLVVRHRAPDHARAFKVIGIVMTSYDDMEVKTLYYPSDGVDNVCENSWTIAKMHFNAAYVTFMALSHYQQSHAYPFTALGIGLERVVNRAHPLSRLLHPSFWRNIGIAWNGLVNVFDGQTGVFSTVTTISGPDLVAHIYPEMAKIKEYNLANPNEVFRKKLSREVREDMKIVKYSKKYFRAFKTFARDFVDTFYESDDDLLNDYELQALAAEMVDPEKANLDAYGFFPISYFQNKKSFAEFLSRSLYAQGFLHHVMNHKLLSHLGFQGFPYRMLATHKYYLPNSDGEIELQGIPPQNLPSAVCDAIDVTDYTGYSLFDDIPGVASQTYTFLQQNIILGAAFKPTFFDLQDLHTFGYPHEQYAAVQDLNMGLAEKLRKIDQNIYDNESHLSLKEGSFLWTPGWGTVTQPVI